MAGPFTMRRLSWTAALMALLALLPGAASAQTCARTITADVVAFDQVWFWNRLGAVQPQGMMYALRRDVVPISGTTLSAGNVRLRSDKRPRPIVLRMNVGDCLRITFQNLLSPSRVDDDQSDTRWASMHAVGMELVSSNLDDGTYVGQNPNGVVNVGQSIVYTLYAGREGEHVIQSHGAMVGGEGDGGHTNSGLFGAIIVEPAGSRWYRSQLTKVDFDLIKTGTTTNGFPILDYERLYTSGSRTGTPIASMLSASNEIMHTDLTAIITGSPTNASDAKPGWFPEGAFPANIYTYPERNQPFREFVIIYHDETGAVQAFPHFEDPVLSHTLHSARDGFAINYGSGGIGAEVLANRLKVGPMHNCTECMYEEFFLSSWTVGDPAMIVDVPANSPCTVANVQSGDIASCTPTQGRKATKAFFPDDPSNVYHSYLSDHVRFRVLHGGSKEHHIHHLHAHQWLYTADSDKSSYLDSQAIGPGASFTAETVYNGSGNVNLTVGDSIFHCHFYPHFAQGMWSLWRVHDVLETGTPMDAAGRPSAGQRALPDGEIFAGTPIPAVVPLPGKPMAPLPARVSIANGQIQIAGAGNPGYPFFVPAQAGHRPPKPPLDTIDDGGLPRHIITAGTYTEAHTRLDFHKDLLTASATAIPEAGSTVEQAAMAFHAQPSHGTCMTNGVCDGTTPVRFATNGRPAIAGAPYADPCPVRPAGPRYDRLYKVADIQDDVTINKKGWHFTQQRFSSLWDDVDDYLFSNKPPEPLFFRSNSQECIEYWLTNLVPREYNLDDFQVRTPTDVLGQHIHLVKFDVTASDGSANGFNYEDGAFSPEEVRARVAAIRAFNGCTTSDARNNTITCPLARLHPFAPFQREEWRGAQTNVQRWWADPVKDNAGNDRTLRTVFTHDHFGPSTHQQVGLYAGLVIEPANSAWYHNETGVQLGTNAGRSSLDGGPTSWQAVIDVPAPEPDHREFMIEFGDFQLAYYEDSQPCRFDAGFGAIRCDDPDDAVNPPGRKEIGLPDLLARPTQCPCHCPNEATTCAQCSSASIPPPCPEALSADDPGTMSVNYRQEPAALRVHDPATNGQAAGNAGDLSMIFSSRVTRAETALNTQPAFYQPLTNDILEKDPYTPLLRVLEGDRVQLRVLVGAHEEGHNFSVQGIKWLFEPSEPNSGYKNSQMMGISEHFEFIVPQLVKNPAGTVDFLWSAGSSVDDYWNGIWGLIRAYTGNRPGLMALPDNPNGQHPPSTGGQFDFSCPTGAPQRALDVTAISAWTSLLNGASPHLRRITYNNRVDPGFGKLFDPTAILYLRTSDIDPSSTVGQPLPGVPIEPLVLRARAGECIVLTLRNRVGERIRLDGFNTLPMLIDNFNANDLLPSEFVGLHPQLFYYDPSRYEGIPVGNNGPATTGIAGPGQTITYKWYAGDIRINSTGAAVATPIEFGATNLISSDRILHASKGAIGALIIEPPDAAWTEDTLTRAAATVTSASAAESPFREFVVQFQNDVNMRIESESGSTVGGINVGDPVPYLGDLEDPEDTGQKAINYRSEPLWKRHGHAADTPFPLTDNFADWFDVLSNVSVGADPQTPVFTATRGQNVRFRVLQSGGHSRNIVFALHGHQWDKEPYIISSTRLGRNNFSFWEGARMGQGPTNHFDALLRNGAGGKFQITGDYLFRDQTGPGLDFGLWGILRVLP